LFNKGFLKILALLLEYIPLIDGRLNVCFWLLIYFVLKASIKQTTTKIVLVLYMHPCFSSKTVNLHHPQSLYREFFL